MTDLLIGNIKLRVTGAAIDSGTAAIPAYAPFLADAADRTPVAGTLRIILSENPGHYAPAGKIVATGVNDLGTSQLIFDGESYSVGISPCPGQHMRYMSFSANFREAVLTLAPADSWNTFVTDSMLRILFSQVAVLESAFLIHSSVVVSADGAHLFMGKSGTGKSTHSRLWIRNFPDCSLLNDDNPLLTVDYDGSVTVHGTPWSGKTPCWRNASASLSSMTRLRQASCNCYTPLADMQAFMALLPGVSVISHCRGLYSAVCDTIRRMLPSVRVGILDCLPDDNAALTCRSEIKNARTANQ